VEIIRLISEGTVEELVYKACEKKLELANKVIIFDQSDNPQDDIQAENRAHRLGQTRPVEIIRLISEGTVEELVYKACEKKLELANKVTGWAVEMTSGEMESAVKNELLRQAVATPPNED
jgi:SWI/SNF-related matrix-associated actin-dependent regulator 1 of chromatin subfamily A